MDVNQLCVSVGGWVCALLTCCYLLSYFCYSLELSKTLLTFSTCCVQTWHTCVNCLWFSLCCAIQQCHGLGTSNGSVDGKRYFECEERCGVFAAVNQISLRDQFQNHRHRLSDECPDIYHSVGAPSPKDISDPASLPLPPLENGERVVWISDTGPELGSVRWIGILPDSRIPEYTIGVEFVSTMFLMLIFCSGTNVKLSCLHCQEWCPACKNTDPAAFRNFHRYFLAWLPLYIWQYTPCPN